MASDHLPAFQGGEQPFLSLKLEQIFPVNHNTKRFRFALPDMNQVSGLTVASAIITLKKNSEPDGPTIRPYTPVSDEGTVPTPTSHVFAESTNTKQDAKGYVDLLIKRYSKGSMSEHIHSLEIGQTLDVKGPIPTYPLKTNQHRHIGMVAGGTGITPMWQIARSIFQDKTDKTKVTLIYGNLSDSDILLKEELDDIKDKFPDRFDVVYTVDNPSPDWNRAKGLITADLLRRNLPAPQEGNVKIFVCGPKGLYDAVSGSKAGQANQGELTGFLQELGYKREQVHKF